MTTEPKTPGDLPNPKPDSVIDPTLRTSSAPSNSPRQVTSDALLQGDREIQIVHGDEVYRLSLTRQGKLILHK